MVLERGHVRRRKEEEEKEVVTKWQLKVPGNGGCAATLFATYRVPSDTSRTNSGRVFAANTTSAAEVCIAGRTGKKAAGIMPKVHDM